MSNNKGRNTNVVDEAARARKLLAKNVPQKLSGLTKTAVVLQQGAVQILGEHAVVAIVTMTQSHQYAISHPIGITGLDESEWVINRVDDIPSMLKRRENPGAGALNQARSRTRTSLAVEAGLLLEQEIEGRLEHFYPNRVDVTRNSLLDEARQAMKENVKAISEEKGKASTALEKSRLGTLLAQSSDVIQYLDDSTQAAESKLRKFWNQDAVREEIERLHPETYRTLTGPFGDSPQHGITGAKGMTLDTVVNRISKMFSETLFQEDEFGTPESQTSPENNSGVGPANNSLQKPTAFAGGFFKNPFAKPTPTQPGKPGQEATTASVSESDIDAGDGEEGTPAKGTSLTPNHSKGKIQGKGSHQKADY